MPLAGPATGQADDYLQEVSLLFTDFPGPFNPERILRLLEPRLKVRIEKSKPDFLIYSVFGDDYLSFPDAVRIFFTGENVRPDFNLCDYAFAYDWMEFGDRYFRCPNYVLYAQYAEILERQRSSVDLTEFEARDFCNFICSNGNAHPSRDRFFRLLSSYRRVDSAGTHFRNTAKSPGAPYQGDWTTPKVEFQRGYKFTIAFENSATVGYTTEKVVHAFAADTIPIYWGNSEVGREFNTRRMVNCHEFESLDAVVERIQELESDQQLLRDVLREPFFPRDSAHQAIYPGAAADALATILRRPPQTARRRNPYVWGSRYEETRRREARAKALLEQQGVLARFIRAVLRYP
jgi:hypothetical protein